MSPEEKSQNTSTIQPKGIKRRAVLGALASLPFFGGFFYSLYVKKAADDARKNEILSELANDGRGAAA